ncbi:MAG: hypothetical protein GY940_24190, partial [bacterium]|nr:hypothetical protein [bacterium]
PAQANTTKLSPREILINPREMARHLKRLRFNYSTEMKIIAKDYLVNDISKFFLNSGATFHTMLLKPMNPGFSEDYKYQSVTTDAETILKKLSHLTGGSVVNSNRIEKFVEEVAGREDIVYMLAYVPDPAETGPPKVRVTVNNPKYRVVFDNQKRAKKFRSARKKLDQKQPDLVIERLLYQNEQLAVKMKNIKMVNYDGKTFGALQTRVYVKDKHKKTIAGFTRIYRGIKKAGVFLVKLPALPPGRYNVVLEVKDLFSMDNKYVGDAIRITQK